MRKCYRRKREFDLESPREWDEYEQQRERELVRGNGREWEWKTHFSTPQLPPWFNEPHNFRSSISLHIGAKMHRLIFAVILPNLCILKYFTEFWTKQDCHSGEGRPPTNTIHSQALSLHGLSAVCGSKNVKSAHSAGATTIWSAYTRDSIYSYAEMRSLNYFL